MRGPIDDRPTVLLEIGDLDELPVVEFPWDPRPVVLLASEDGSPRKRLPLSRRHPPDNGQSP
jgi:hypothetical protein